MRLRNPIACLVRRSIIVIRMRTNMVVMNIRKFFTELVNPLGYTRLGYIVFFGKATEGSALLKMKKVVVGWLLRKR